MKRTKELSLLALVVMFCLLSTQFAFADDAFPATRHTQRDRNSAKPDRKPDKQFFNRAGDSRRSDGGSRIDHMDRRSGDGDTQRARVYGKTDGDDNPRGKNYGRSGYGDTPRGRGYSRHDNGDNPRGKGYGRSGYGDNPQSRGYSRHDTGDNPRGRIYGRSDGDGRFADKGRPPYRKEHSYDKEHPPYGYGHDGNNGSSGGQPADSYPPVARHPRLSKKTPGIGYGDSYAAYPSVSNMDSGYQDTTTYSSEQIGSYPYSDPYVYSDYNGINADGNAPFSSITSIFSFLNSLKSDREGFGRQSDR